MNRDFYQHEEEEEPSRGRDHLFLWTVGILLLIGVALATWLGTFYIFGYPERPQSYAILQKLKKLDPPQRFQLTKAPPGEFISAEKAYERYAGLNAYELKRLNELLLRDYIRNYDKAKTKRLIPYLTGRYTIMRAYELKEGDFFGSGVVAIAQSVDNPKVVIEHVYPAPKGVVPVLENMLASGLDIMLERRSDLAALINVARTPDGRMQFTVVPLLYGSYALKQGQGSFNLEPPLALNPAAGLPMIREELFLEGAREYAAFQQKQRGGIAEAGSTPTIPVARPVAETTIVRVPTEPTPEATPEITVAEATPAVVVTEEATPPELVEEGTTEPESSVDAPLEEEGVARALPVHTPEVAPAVVQRSTPTPTPQRVVAVATPLPATPQPTPVRVAVAQTPEPRRVVEEEKPILQPFLAAKTPQPVARPSGRRNWRTYQPGRMPRGRLMDLSEAADLADRGVGGERSYLQGSFIVTATNDNRAVLRPNSRIGNMIGSVIRQRPPRVIVEFPDGAALPAERASISRADDRPFEIRDVQRGADGQINIYVREVTTP